MRAKEVTLVAEDGVLCERQSEHMYMCVLWGLGIVCYRKTQRILVHLDNKYFEFLLCLQFIIYKCYFLQACTIITFILVSCYYVCMCVSVRGPEGGVGAIFIVARS